MMDGGNLMFQDEDVNPAIRKMLFKTKKMHKHLERSSRVQSVSTLQNRLEDSRMTAAPLAS